MAPSMAEPVRAFVCGHPVAHSRSPLIHGHWLERLAIPGSYERIDIAPDEIRDFIDTLGERGFAGGNFTIPHKEAAVEAVDRRDEAAEMIGAVNTVWREDGRLLGSNTDAPGFSANLDQYAPAWRDGRKAAVLGAGGAARAVLFALLEAGYTDDVDLLVNTTSLGMDGDRQSPADVSTLPESAIVTDIVYVPLVTPLLDAAAARGLQTVDGLGMLLHQAAPGFARWFGRMPEVTDELRALVIDDMGRHR